MRPKLHILVVEDHASTNDTLVRMLKREGHQVVAAKTGEIAVDSGMLADFHLVICDIGLPDTNGWELLKKLRKHQPSIRAIALTGYGYPNDMKQSTLAGFDMHLTKPMSWPSIQGAITSLFPEIAARESEQRAQA